MSDLRHRQRDARQDVSDCKHWQTRLHLDKTPERRTCRRTCVTCGETFSLGKATESPQTAVERRAAELVNADGKFANDIADSYELMGAIWYHCDLTERLTTPAHWAGWLALHIIHDAWHIAHEGGET